MLLIYLTDCPGEVNLSKHQEGVLRFSHFRDHRIHALRQMFGEEMYILLSAAA